MDINLKDKLNLASQANFKIDIPNLPLFSAFSQSFDLPDVTLGRAVQPTPLVDIKQPGDKLDFDDLNISFLLDENMTNFKEIFKWMIHLGYPKSTNEYKALLAEGSQYTRKQDIYVTTLTNKYNAFNTVIFVGCFPTNIGGVPFNHTSPGVDHPVVNVIFAYDHYYFGDME